MSARVWHYSLAGTLRRAVQKDGETPADAVARAASAVVGGAVTLWPFSLDERGRECWRAEWFGRDEVFHEAPVHVYTWPARGES